MDPIQPLAHQTLGVRVYSTLRERLMAGQFQPGERLTLAALSQALGTSAMPVREALGRLAAEEALEILPNKSVRVPVMTSRRFRELVTIRIEVEGLAMMHAAVRITAPELERLSALEDEFSTQIAAEQPDVNRVIRVNMQFHFGIYRAAGMPTLCTLIEGLWLRIGPVLNLDIRQRPGRLAIPPAVQAHRAMLRALQAGDAAEAKRALAKDIESAAEWILAGDKLPP